jgi:hypothetical protein
MIFETMTKNAFHFLSGLKFLQVFFWKTLSFLCIFSLSFLAEKIKKSASFVLLRKTTILTKKAKHLKQKYYFCFCFKPFLLSIFCQVSIFVSIFISIFVRFALHKTSFLLENYFKFC